MRANRAASLATSAIAVAIVLLMLAPAQAMAGPAAKKVVTPQWTDLNLTGSTPKSGYGGEMTYDATLGKIVFMGNSRNGVTNTTWLMGTTHWTIANHGAFVYDLWGAGLVYDPALNGDLLFGGQSAFGLNNHTWLFHNGTWSVLNVSTWPGARVFPSMTYDAVDGYVLLFGGDGYHTVQTPCGGSSPPCNATNTPHPLNDTWAFYNGTWWSINTTGPTPSIRDSAGLAYSPTTNRVVLFGGNSAKWAGTHWAGFPVNDTWTYAAGKWTHITGIAPPGVSTSVDQMAYDTELGTVVLYDTQGATLWQFSAGQWSQIITTSYPPKLPSMGEEMIFDTARHALVLWNGGQSGNPKDPLATWILK
jgi:hypothetical protein